MNKPELRVSLKPELVKPVFVQGLPGFGEVGQIAARLLIDFVEAKPFAELYAPYFPDYIIINDSGICRFPKYDFHYCSTCKPNLLTLTGDVQPRSDDINAHYELSSLVLDFAKEMGCKRFVTLGGFPMRRGAERIYVAATSKKLASTFAKKGGGAVYGGGKIVGAAGLLLGLAKSQNLHGVCILGATPGYMPDRQAALLVFRFLTKVLALKR